MTAKLIRALSLTLLKQSRIPAYMVTSLVNEMWMHFSPAEDLTTLRVRAENDLLMFIMELPEKEN